MTADLAKDRLLLLAASGATRGEASTALGVCLARVSQLCKQFDIKLKALRVREEDVPRLKAKVRELVLSGYTREEAAQHLGITRTSAFRWAEGLPYRKGKRPSSLAQQRNRTRASWKAMLERCYRPSSASYPNYGARGITVCEQWRKSSRQFIKDMGVRPLGMTLERIDTSAGYEPSNCKWATPKEQARNKRSNRFITFRGETLCLKDWARRIGIDKAALSARIKAGWPLHLALTVPRGRPGELKRHLSSGVAE